MHTLTLTYPGNVSGGNWGIGATERVYFENRPLPVIGYKTTLIGWDVGLDCIYQGHYNQWSLPIYEIIPIYAKSLI